MADAPGQARATLTEAATLMSERLAAEGASLQPEFEDRQEQMFGDDAPAEEVEQEEAGAESELEPEESAETGADAESEGFTLPETVNELAEMLGVEASALYGLKLNMPLDGNESAQRTLEELKDIAKRPMQDDIARQRELDQQRAREQELAAQEQYLQQQREQADLLAQTVLGQMQREEQQAAEAFKALLDNSAYSQANPQEYQVALMRAKARLEQAQTQKAGLVNDMQTMHQRAEEEKAQKALEAQQSGRTKLREWFPEWQDDAAFEAGAGELSTYLLGSKMFSQDEIANCIDPRLFRLAEKARRYDALEAKAKEQPRPTAKARLIPGAPQVRLPRGRRAELEAHDRLKSSGSIDDARAVLTQRLKQLGG